MKDNLTLISLITELSQINKSTNVNYSNVLNKLYQWNLDNGPINYNCGWEPKSPAKFSIIEDFKNPTGWSGTPAYTNIAGGVMQNITTTQPFSLIKNFTTPVSVNENLIFNFYISDITALEYLNILVTDKGNIGSDYSTANVINKLSSQENTIVVRRSEFSSVGAGTDWSKVNAISIVGKLKTNTQTVTVITNKIESFTPKALCSIWFDDGWASPYNQGYQYMKNKGFPGVNAFMTDYIGYVPYFYSLAMAKTVQTSGWENTNHTMSHPDLASLTAAEIEKEIKGGLDYLLNNGFGAASFYFAPPYTSYNDTVLSIAKKYCLVNRRMEDIYNLNPLVDLNAIGYREVTNEVTPQTVQQWVNEAIAHGYWLVLLFHRLETPATESTQYTPPNFKLVMDNLYSQRANIDVVNVTQAILRMYGSSK